MRFERGEAFGKGVVLFPGFEACFHVFSERMIGMPRQIPCGQWSMVSGTVEALVCFTCLRCVLGVVANVTKGPRVDQ